MYVLYSRRLFLNFVMHLNASCIKAVSMQPSELILNIIISHLPYIAHGHEEYSQWQLQ